MVCNSEVEVIWHYPSPSSYKSHDQLNVGDNIHLCALFLYDNKHIYSDFREQKNTKVNITWGSTEKGEESPTSPAVNEAAGVWILNPSFLSMKASPLSDMI